ncbi:MAG TPA: copper transporter, partial [Acidimicrobiales bacterium]|nr:copper transporter [Acidimicrobiales bacterium]
MINLRYHIVSITAVFLALAIGLLLGTSLLERVTVDELKSQLDQVEREVRATEGEIGALRAEVGAFESQDADLAAQLAEQLFAGQLEGVPVLVLTTQGTDEELVADAVRAVSGAGAALAGTWRLTDRWDLAEEGDTDTLAGLLDLGTRDRDRLRRNAAIRLSELLGAAAAEAPDPTVQIAPPEATEPPFVFGLVQAGFVEYQPLQGVAESRVLLPGAGTRYLVVSGRPADDSAQTFAVRLLEELAAESVAPAVAAQGAVELPDESGERPSEDVRRTTFVGAIRAGSSTGCGSPPSTTSTPPRGRRRSCWRCAP